MVPGQTGFNSRGNSGTIQSYQAQVASRQPYRMKAPFASHHDKQDHMGKASRSSLPGIQSNQVATPDHLSPQLTDPSPADAHSPYKQQGYKSKIDQIRSLSNKRSLNKLNGRDQQHMPSRSPATPAQASYRRPDTHRSQNSGVAPQTSHRQAVLTAAESAWTQGSARPWTQQGRKPNYGVNSRPGQHGAMVKTNQDNFLMVNSSEGNFVAAVMDGHGEQGHNVSKFVKDNLAPQLVQCHTDVSGDINKDADVVKSAFLRVEQALSKSRIEAQSSGSTAVACARKGNKLLIANVGDSRAVLGRAHPSLGVQAVALTTDHTLKDHGERNRCRQAGGQVEPIYVPGLGYRGPARLWKVKQREGGLAVSRAFGDMALRDAGVSAVPDVRVQDITPDDRFVILASDGVWDYVSNDEACQIAQGTADPREASNLIVEKARSRWEKSGGGYVDDVTALVARLD